MRPTYERCGRREAAIAEKVVVEEIQVAARETLDFGERRVDRLRVEGAAAFEERFLVIEVSTRTRFRWCR